MGFPDARVRLLLLFLEYLNKMTEVRTRIAPSPTGMMHLGTARTAIYCWAVARHFGGKFMLRIEDTDQERSTDEATQVILDSMKWLNLDYDNQGEVVYQMKRLPRYKEVADSLIAKGLAYWDYCTKEELDAMREAQRARGEKPRYDGRWRPERAKELGLVKPEGVKPVLRFKNPDEGEVTWNDAVYGTITVANKELDDLIIMRADGIPTYNFAVVVDDIDMKMTHVIRGADHINNTPRQINLYRALGVEPPIFGHLPLINGPDGKKLSKRHGSVAVTEYQKAGYLPEAIFNYLARLGWGHGDMEKFSREELAKVFVLSDCSRAAARMDFKKLAWLNAQYMKEADDARLAGLVRDRIAARGGDPAAVDLVKVCALLKSRAQTLEDLAEAAMIFYGPYSPVAADIEKALANGGKEALAALLPKLEALPEWKAEGIYAAMKAVCEAQGIKFGVIASPVRVIAVAANKVPGIDQTLEIIGKDKVISRLKAYV